MRLSCTALAAVLALVLWVLPLRAWANEPDWSVGGYVGQYHDTESAGVLNGSAKYIDHYMLALTGAKSIWRSSTWPVSIEIDGMIGYQSGAANLGEIAIAPALRWSGFPWRDTVRTDFRIAPLGISYTSIVSPLEKGPDGRGTRTLNYLFLEVAFSSPKAKEDEFFVRLHHRCAIYDLLNNYGANGEDFLSLGYRYRF